VTFLTDVRDTIAPHRGSAHGPLPPLLVGVTLVTGLVDAFSYLTLGHVFVANMTGNVVFFAFALAGDSDFSISGSLLALASFGVGALFGGRLGSRLGQHRGHLLYTAATLQASLLLVSIVLVAFSGNRNPVQGWYLYALVVVLSVCMGLQNAVARKLAVPDMTTTVLTLTITGVAADSALAGGSGSKAGRRLVAVCAMIVGAFIGAVCVLRGLVVYPLVLALGVMALVAVTAWRLGISNPPWSRPSA